MHIVWYLSLLWAVRKRRNRSRCSLACWVRWVWEHVFHGNIYAVMGRGTFGGVWPIEKHCKA